MSSVIDIYVYKVSGIKNNLNSKYKFSKLSEKKNNNKSNNSIKIITNKEKKVEYNKYQENFIFSKDIIKSKEDNNEEINLKKNYKNLYELYKTFIVRNNIISIVKLLKTENFLKNFYPKNNYKDLKKIIDNNMLIFWNYIKDKITIKEDFHTNTELIYYIEEKNENNIIVIGDNHGSFHSFFRIFLRLYYQGIIDNDFKLNDKYKLILLGDLIDRGNYSFEILFILLKLMEKNNTKDNLKVILIRGNHEENETSSTYGFKNEINKKFNQEKKTNDTIYKKFMEFFYHLPSAIILKHNNTKYWLCHGGFDIKDINGNLYQNIEKKKVIFKSIKESQIRWNDFSGVEEDIDGRYQGLFKKIGNDTLFKFLNKFDIDFIIRGHNDDFSNASLLKNYDEKYNKNENIQHYFTKILFYINTKKNKALIDEDNLKERTRIISERNYNTKTYRNISNRLGTTRFKNFFPSFQKSNEKKITEKIVQPILPVIEYNKNNNKNNNQIATIFPKNFEKKKYFIHNNNIELYPVLTISNNSDKDRRLYNDSYIIIKPKKTK